MEGQLNAPYLKAFHESKMKFMSLKQGQVEKQSFYFRGRETKENKFFVLSFPCNNTSEKIESA